MESFKRAVCSLILYPTDPKFILGISRRYARDQFGLVGGKVDIGETDEQAIIRETWEETGLGFYPVHKVMERIVPGKETFTVATFRGTVDLYPPIDWSASRKEGIIKWCSYKELLDGPFSEYNKLLFSHLNLI